MRSPSRQSQSHLANRKRARQIKNQSGGASEKKIKLEAVEHLEQETEVAERNYAEDNHKNFYEERLRSNQISLLRYETTIEEQSKSIHRLTRDLERQELLMAKMTREHQETLRVSEAKLEQSRKNSLDDDLLIGKYLRKIEKYKQKLKQVRQEEMRDSLVCKFIQACEDLDFESIRCCLKLGVDINGRSSRTATKSGAAVFALIESNSLSAGAALGLLMEMEKLDLNTRDELGNTPLIRATALANVAAVKMLCRGRGVDVNLSNQLDNTALIQAVRGNNLDLVRFFRDEVPTMDWNKNSPIVDAVQEGNVEILRIFLQTPGVRLTNLAGSDSSLQAVAVQSEDGDPVGCLKLLTEDLRLSWTEPCLETGESPLLYALHHQRTEVVKILLEVPNIDTSGITAPRHIEVMRSVMCRAVAELNQRKSQVPECPVCLTIFQPARKVFQCEAGHFVCEECFQNPAIQDSCSVCRCQMMGRAHGFEHFLRQMF